MTGPEQALLRIWRAAVSAAHPEQCLGGHWPPPPPGRLAVLACGKAAVAMAAEAARHYGNGCTGIVIFPDESGAAPRLPGPGLRAFPASHPIPDERSERAARAALELASGLGPEDLLLVLLSGGASSLMCLPAPGVSLREKQQMTRDLLACGASIREINCVRRQLSCVKGGRLARRSAAPVFTLAISDVPGDDPVAIGSGPTVADPSTPVEAQAVLARYGIDVAPAIQRALRNTGSGGGADRDDARDGFRIVASGGTALAAAERWCEEHALPAQVQGDHLEGDAAELARSQARQALRLAAGGRAVCLLSGGETTVTLGPAPGTGGRNSEYALALALALDGHAGIWALAADTDGIDGCGGHSGAIVGPHTLAQARRLGLDGRDYLLRHDSATFFRRAGGLLEEGPTGTNVNDFRAILVNYENPASLSGLA